MVEFLALKKRWKERQNSEYFQIGLVVSAVASSNPFRSKSAPSVTATQFLPFPDENEPEPDEATAQARAEDDVEYMRLVAAYYQQKRTGHNG